MRPDYEAHATAEPQPLALAETIRLMGEIDEVIEQHGGWPGAFQTAEAGEAARRET